jgi:hypothetical protein
MRGFAAGLWLAGLVMAYFYYTSQHDAAQTDAKPEGLTEAQVQQFLNEHNQIAVDKSTYESLQATARKQETKADKSGEKGKKTGETHKKKETIRSYTLHIKSGMTIEEIGTTLEKANIIRDEAKLRKYLHNHDMEKYVQLGTFKLKSDMSIPEIAKKITS